MKKVDPKLYSLCFSSKLSSVFGFRRPRHEAIREKSKNMGLFSLFRDLPLTYLLKKNIRNSCKKLCPARKQG